MQKQEQIRIRTGPMCPWGWGTAQAQGVSSIFPKRLRPRWAPRAAAPAPWQTGAAAPREVPAAMRRRADCHTACESRRLAAAPAPSRSGVAGTRAPRLALCGGQRRKVRLGCLPGQAGQPSDPSRGQAGMKCELHHLTPFLSHSTNTSKPLGCLEIPDMPCELWWRLGGSERSRSNPGQQVSGLLGWEESLSR